MRDLSWVILNHAQQTSAESETATTYSENRTTNSNVLDKKARSLTSTAQSLFAAVVHFKY